MIQFSVVFNYKNRLRKNGTGLIQIRAYQDGKCRFFSTNIYVTPYQWSKKKKIVIDHPNTFHLNGLIRTQTNELEAYALDLTKQHGAVTLQQLDGFFKYDDIKSFTSFWKYELQHNETLAEATKTRHKTTLNYWRAFKKDILFSELDYALIDEFNTFLYKKKIKANTIYNHHKQVRKYINLAIRKSMFDVNKNPYLQFKPKTEKTKRTVLTENEVQLLEQLTFAPEDNYLERIRDMFLFSCYTGLRFGDTSQLTTQNIEQDKQGLVLKLIAQKTNKQLILPLYKLHNEKPQLIIKKHLPDYLKPTDFIFHNYANQYFNRALKVIAKKAGINKKVTSHVARHTFATHLANKVPIHILKAILQHSKIETTMIYLHLSNKMVNDALDSVDW